MKHTIRGKMTQGVPFCPTIVAKRSNSIFFLIFPISQEYNHMCLHFVIEYMYCPSLSIPANYHDNRLDIFDVGSIFLSYAILPRTFFGSYDLCFSDICWDGMKYVSTKIASQLCFEIGYNFLYIAAVHCFEYRSLCYTSSSPQYQNDALWLS